MEKTTFLPLPREHDQQQLLPNVVPDPSEQAGRSAAKTSRPRPLSANTIRQRAVKSLDESAKRLKAIEVSQKGYDYYKYQQGIASLVPCVYL